MISKQDTEDRMIRHAENRTGCDSGGGSAAGRNMNRAATKEPATVSAMLREGQLFADGDVVKPRNYQMSAE